MSEWLTSIVVLSAASIVCMTGAFLSLCVLLLIRSSSPSSYPGRTQPPPRAFTLDKKEDEGDWEVRPVMAEEVARQVSSRMAKEAIIGGEGGLNSMINPPGEDSNWSGDDE